eukprot:197195_1
MPDNSDPDTLRVLLATDIHLGCFEKDELREPDSFRAFEEILKIGVEKKVDLVLLGGDLFHVSKPSLRSLHKCMRLLKKYSFGDRPINFDIVSDQKLNFPSEGRANFEDPNLNISMPVFSIHGNHDDPVGVGHYAAMDLMSVSNLVNYFGKATDLDNIQIYPVLFKKGITRFACYGLGSVRDERLNRVFERKKVKFVRPSAEKDGWFNMFVIHQNRTPHSQQFKNNIAEEILPSFLDLVFWGHEHECRIQLTESLTGNFFITQPGSSVRTSLCQGELPDKHVGILEIRGETCRLLPVKLESLRPFLMHDIALEDYFDPEVEISEIEAFLAKETVKLIKQANPDKFSLGMDEKEEAAAFGSVDKARIPLIRLRVNTSGFDQINTRRFSKQFVGKVANPEDVILLQKTAKQRTKGNSGKDVTEQLVSMFQKDGVKIPDLVGVNLDGERPMSILVPNSLTSAVQSFVDKNESHAIEDFVHMSLDEVSKKLKSADGPQNPKNIQDEVFKIHTEKKRKEEDSQFEKDASDRRRLEKIMESVGGDSGGVEGESEARASGSRSSRASSSRSRTIPSESQLDEFKHNDPDEEHVREVTGRILGRGEDGSSPATVSAGGGRGKGGGRGRGGRGRKKATGGGRRRATGRQPRSTKKSAVIDLDSSDGCSEGAPPSARKPRGAKSKQKKGADSGVSSLFGARSSRSSRNAKMSQASQSRNIASYFSQSSNAAPSSAVPSDVVDLSAAGNAPSTSSNGFVSKKRKSEALAAAVHIPESSPPSTMSTTVSRRTNMAKSWGKKKPRR